MCQVKLKNLIQKALQAQRSFYKLFSRNLPTVEHNNIWDDYEKILIMRTKIYHFIFVLLYISMEVFDHTPADLS